MTDRLLTFYGDDFTGSTDALEGGGFARNSECAVFGSAIGRASREVRGLQGDWNCGESRSRGPEWMDEHLPPVFREHASNRSADLPVQSVFHVR